VRYDLDNASALCRHCHQFLGENPMEHKQFIENKLGKQRFIRLQSRASMPGSRDPHLLRLIAKHYREQGRALDSGYHELEPW
jgi:hypothetical protein